MPRARCVLIWERLKTSGVTFRSGWITWNRLTSDVIKSNLLEELGVGTVINHVAGVALSLREDTEATRDEAGPAVPEHERPLPVVLSVEEVTRLIGSARTCFTTPCS